MKNIHVTSTDKPSRLYLGNNGNFVFGMVQTSIQSRNSDFTNQNIYITSDEEIKDVRPHKGKWHLEKENILNKFPDYLTDLSECKLVIMTTDQDLIKDGVQAIDDEFLEWFVKNPSCEEVYIVRDFGVGLDNSVIFYKINIPKEEPTSCACGANISCQCEPEQSVEEYEQQGLEKYSYEFKQETLEEAAREYWRRGQFGLEKAADTETAFLKGAKWQQEQFKNESTANYIDRHIVEAMVETAKQKRMFSEEEVEKQKLEFAIKELMWVNVLIPFEHKYAKDCINEKIKELEQKLSEL